MKNEIKYRNRTLRNFIYEEDTRKKCRLEDVKHQKNFTRNRRLPYYVIYS